MQPLNEKFWYAKKVLVTGHTGFKGSWLCLWLQSMGAEVCGFALEPPTNPALFDVADVSSGMLSIIGDIRNIDAVRNVFSSFKPQIVLHLAAQPLVKRSYIDPIETYATNVIGTVNLLEAARESDTVRAIVNVTTDKCYENREWFWGYREDEPMGGYDPYSSSKGCSELVTSAYRRSFLNSKQIALASARAGNVVGGGDWAQDRLVPDILRSFENNTPVLVRNPLSIRPWQHVLEPLSGYLALAERLFTDGDKWAQAWNFGPKEEDARSVEWIVTQMAIMWDGDASWRLDQSNHPHEANYLKLDISKAKALLGWEPRWNLETALFYIKDWHQAWMSGSNMKQVCFNQISVFNQTI